MNNLAVSTSQSNFDLKTKDVELVGTSVHRSADKTLGELEAMRLGGDVIPASKHGLENITGASCETGAQ
ncbi:MAG: hypothetical protein CSA74_01800 [Rhodobacterales bacterium]|nr:MAG: hypothetical protein CSA74_01800 [Rhodobacterales bacterium]